jgi:hypothetical protein
MKYRWAFERNIFAGTTRIGLFRHHEGKRQIARVTWEDYDPNPNIGHDPTLEVVESTKEGFIHDLIQSLTEQGYLSKSVEVQALEQRLNGLLVHLTDMRALAFKDWMNEEQKKMTANRVMPLFDPLGGDYAGR